MFLATCISVSGSDYISSCLADSPVNMKFPKDNRNGAIYVYVDNVVI
jgi:hypothetical protein